jgi:hypothetical protein
MQNAPPVVRQQQEHIQDLEADRRHRKKVDGNHTASHLPGSEQAKALPVPADDGRGFDDKSSE